MSAHDFQMIDYYINQIKRYPKEDKNFAEIKQYIMNIMTSPNVDSLINSLINYTIQNQTLVDFLISQGAKDVNFLNLLVERGFPISAQNKEILGKLKKDSNSEDAEERTLEDLFGGWNSDAINSNDNPTKDHQTHQQIDTGPRSLEDLFGVRDDEQPPDIMDFILQPLPVKNISTIDKLLMTSTLKVKPGFSNDLSTIPESPLIMALNANPMDRKVVEEYITKKQYINIPNKDRGMTPLMYAVQNRDKDLIKLLIANGANPFITDVYAFTALDQAIGLRLTELIPILKLAQDEYLSQNNRDVEEWLNFKSLKQMISYDFGHILGITSNYFNRLFIDAPIFKKQFQVCIETEGASEIETISSLADDIESYINEVIGLKKETTALVLQSLENKQLSEVDIDSANNLQDFKEIHKAFQLASNFIKTGDKKHLNEMIENSKKQEPPQLVIIPSCWNSPSVDGGLHGIGIGICGNLLFVTNRGEGKEETGTTIYKLKSDFVLTEEILLGLFTSHPAPSMQEVKERINALIEPNTIGIPIGQSVHQRGSCAISNRKSLIEPSLAAKEFYRLSVDERNGIFESMKLDRTVQDRSAAKQKALEKLAANESLKKILGKAENDYKPTTSFFRNKKINLLINKLKDPNDKNKQVYIEVAAKYLLEHMGTPKLKKYRGVIPKPIQELERARVLLEKLYLNTSNEILCKMEALLPGSIVKLFHNALEQKVDGLVRIMLNIPEVARVLSNNPSFQSQQRLWADKDKLGKQEQVQVQQTHDNAQGQPYTPYRRKE